MTLKFCPKCGGKLDSDAVFCNLCGEDLRDRIKPKKEVETLPASKPKSVKTSKQQTSIEEQFPKRATVVEFGGFLERFFAWLIDIIIIFIISGVIWFLIGRLSPFIFNIVSFLLGILYFWLLESKNDGKTLGKAMFKLQCLDEDSLQPATSGRYFINNITKTTSIWFIPLIVIDVLFGLLVNSGDPKKKIRLTQNMAKSVVIKTR